MKIFITGINGFIGSRLAFSLLKKGHTVSGTVRPTSDLSLLREVAADVYSGNLFHSEFLEEAMAGSDIVFHVAGLASDWGSFQQFFDSNVRTTQQVARTAKRVNAQRFVFLSSAAVYGFSGFRFADEKFPVPKWNFPYARTKIIAENWLLSFFHEANLPVTIVQPANVFGPADRTFFIPFIRALRPGFIPLIDHGKAWTSPLFVENLCEALWLAATSPKSVGEKIIISDGLEINWEQFIAAICQKFNVPKPRFSVPFGFALALADFFELLFRLFRISHPPPVTRYRVFNFGRDYHFSTNKANRLLGFSPKIGLNAALEKTKVWLEKIEHG
ncbi:MAG: NAD-dependent epimerase/dehydratase family protein [Calditrichaeota bacterium]|nr:NAD-dependent epimerase/dehydratase family protein [Calditrichota bacterium]